LGPEGAAERFQPDECHPLSELGQLLPALLRSAERLHYRLGRGDELERHVLQALSFRRARGARTGTGPLAVVDPGVGTVRTALAFLARKHFFVGPDNGIFSGILRGAEVEAVALPTPRLASPTFHGRDLFAPAAAALARGESLGTLGERFAGIPRRVSGAAPQYEGKMVVGEVVYVDRYGNLITNLTPDIVPAYAVLEAESLVIGPVRATFGDVPSGALLAYVGSGGSVEIAVRDGSAARRLGLGVGGRIRARLG
jgi:hypothetical protein